VPIAVVLDQALSQGLGVYRRAVDRPRRARGDRADAEVAAIAVPLNVVFGVAAAWAIAHFRFRGRALLRHADRSAVRGLAGDLRHDVRAAVRRTASLGPWRASTA
jgi:hypothetical protein